MDEAGKIREAIKHWRDAMRFWAISDPGHQNAVTVIDAAEKYADYLQPMVCKTRTQEVWHVEYAQDRGGIGHPSVWMPQCCLHFTEDSARDFAAMLGKSELSRCIKVTGPHRQQVPV